MKLSVVSFTIILFFTAFQKTPQTNAWIRVNQMGYKPDGIKVAVWCGKEQLVIDKWQLVSSITKEVVYSTKFEKSFGAYGPFTQTYRLNFSSFSKARPILFASRGYTIS
jgi:hypothetical protein